MTETGERPAQAARRRAEHLLELHRPDAALAALAPALAGDPADSQALCLAAHAQLARHDPEEAERFARRALAADPAGEWALRLLALSLLQQRRWTESYDTAQAAVRAAPEIWPTHHTLASVASAIPGLGAVAWQAASRAVELAPLEPDTHAMKGRVALDRDRAQAVAALREALRLDPGHAGAINDLGRLRLRRWDAFGAAAQFGRALRADVRLSVAADNIETALQGAASAFGLLVWALLVGLAELSDVLPAQVAWAAGGLAVALAAGGLGWLLRGLRRVPRREAARYLVAVGRGGRRTAAALGFLGLETLALVVMCAVPPGSPRWTACVLGTGAFFAAVLALPDLGRDSDG